MKTAKRKTGLTLVELLITIAVLAILTVSVITVGGRVRTQAEIRLAESTISILVAALEQYYDFHDAFPPDCENYTAGDLAIELGGTGITGGYDPEFASGLALHYHLSKVPDSKRILDTINESLITGKDLYDSGTLTLVITEDEKVTLLRVLDPWGTSLRYKYEEGWNFPLITSAGPDGNFETEWDNITSKGR